MVGPRIGAVHADDRGEQARPVPLAIGVAHVAVRAGGPGEDGGAAGIAEAVHVHLDEAVVLLGAASRQRHRQRRQGNRRQDERSQSDDGSHVARCRRRATNGSRGPLGDVPTGDNAGARPFAKPRGMPRAPSYNEEPPPMRWIDTVRRIAAAARGSLRVRAPAPRIVRRMDVECPHGRGRVEVDLLLDRSGRPKAVVRCSAHEACPPTCDQACRQCADAVVDRPHAILVYPGTGPLEEID
jgi:hypothetical protein